MNCGVERVGIGYLYCVDICFGAIAFGVLLL